MDRLRPYQPYTSVPIVNFPPGCDHACEPGHDPQNLPITHQRPLRNVGVSHADNRERKYGQAGELRTKEGAAPSALFGSTLIWGYIRFAHKWIIRSLVGASLVLLRLADWNREPPDGLVQVADAYRMRFSGGDT